MEVSSQRQAPTMAPRAPKSMVDIMMKALEKGASVTAFAAMAACGTAFEAGATQDQATNTITTTDAGTTGQGGTGGRKGTGGTPSTGGHLEGGSGGGTGGTTGTGGHPEGGTGGGTGGTTGTGGYLEDGGSTGGAGGGVKIDAGKGGAAGHETTDAGGNVDAGNGGAGGIITTGSGGAGGITTGPGGNGGAGGIITTGNGGTGGEGIKDAGVADAEANDAQAEAGAPDGSAADAGNDGGDAGADAGPVVCNPKCKVPAVPECETIECVGGNCVDTVALYGKLLNNQVTGDCKLNVCDGNGGMIAIADDNDTVPASDPCIIPICSNGVPGEASNNGADCNKNGGVICKDKQCVTLNSPINVTGKNFEAVFYGDATCQQVNDFTGGVSKNPPLYDTGAIAYNAIVPKTCVVTVVKDSPNHAFTFEVTNPNHVKYWEVYAYGMQTPGPYPLNGAPGKDMQSFCTTQPGGTLITDIASVDKDADPFKVRIEGDPKYSSIAWTMCPK